jgi:hypothetical protein
LPERAIGTCDLSCGAHLKEGLFFKHIVLGYRPVTRDFALTELATDSYSLRGIKDWNVSGDRMLTISQMLHLDECGTVRLKSVVDVTGFIERCSIFQSSCSHFGLSQLSETPANELPRILLANTNATNEETSWKNAVIFPKDSDFLQF